ncbi:MAG TPA: hypothetical protein VNN17_10560 [Terriglobia bacterium]|nr:hypothetical protein [Terriglobia bacterium]
MFAGFPAELRKNGLHADARTIAQLYTLMSRGLIRDLGSLYSCAERLVVKDPRQRGPYTVAFFSHFLDIPILPGQSLEEAVLRSDTFYHWRLAQAPGRQPTPELIDEFLERIFRRKPDVSQPAPVPGGPGLNTEGIEVPFSEGEAAADEFLTDHSDKDLEELLRRMREIAEQQQEAHRGGAKYIGTGGTSPYGHDGRSAAGIRVGGRSAFLSARVVLGNPRYFPVDLNAVLSDDNVDAALAALKGVAERHSELTLDIDETIRKGADRGGLFLPQLTQREEETLNVMLFIDNGGFSMDVHIPVVRALFRKMKTRFAHDLRIFYFHNVIRETVFADEARSKEPVSLESLLREGKHHRVFIVGDASMAPYELHGHGWGKSGYECLRQMAAAFPKIAWLNPIRDGSWYGTQTVEDIRSIIPMFPLTPRGIEKAVHHLNRQATAASDKLRLPELPL